jgi:DNA-binding response OmpR family regulator
VASSVPSSRVLVAEDDDAIRFAVEEILRHEGLDVFGTGDGAAALEAALTTAPDAVVLDVNLPGLSGLEVLARLRRTTDVPVLLLTGRSDESDRVLGLELGADDYVVKPFFARELGARVRALLRRAAVGRDVDEVLDFDGLTIDVAARTVTVAGDVVEMTAREFDLLAFLARTPGKVFTRAELLSEVWASSAEWQSIATVTEHVHRLRAKIDRPAGTPWIRTVPRVGYSFAA